MYVLCYYLLLAAAHAGSDSFKDLWFAITPSPGNNILSASLRTSAGPLLARHVKLWGCGDERLRYCTCCMCCMGKGDGCDGSLWSWYFFGSHFILTSFNHHIYIHPRKYNPIFLSKQRLRSPRWDLERPAEVIAAIRSTASIARTHALLLPRHLRSLSIQWHDFFSIHNSFSWAPSLISQEWS